MEEKTLHLPAMRCREMNRLGMRRTKRQCVLSLFTQRPHTTPQALALGSTLAPYWRRRNNPSEPELKAKSNIAPFLALLWGVPVEYS